MTTNAASPVVQVSISPHDPLVVRDGRPFAAGGEGANRARSLDWPHPSTTAGAVRTFFGRLAAGTSAAGGAENPFYDAAFIERLKGIRIWGPLPQVSGELYVPAPRDYLTYESGKSTALRPRPLRDGEGCNLPQSSLWPAYVSCSEKPNNSAAFWSMSDAVRWLVRDMADGFAPVHVLESFKKDERVHVRIDPASQTADDSQLFMTQGLIIPDADHQRSDYLDDVAPGLMASATHLAVLVQPRDGDLAVLAGKIAGLQPFGGERRLAYFQAEKPAESWKCPNDMRKGLDDATGVRMVLATPAIFAHGWLPGWLDAEKLEGSPPGAHGVRLRLRGACTGRWQALSGWNMQKGCRGPKPIRRLVPAGSVYFFEVISGTARELANLWLVPVSDTLQDRNDGFGLAMWGVWEAEVTEGGSRNEWK